MAQMDVERPRRASPARGVALIATAVIIGLFVLRNGFELPEAGDGDSPPAVEADGATGGDGASTGTTTPPTTPPVTARDPSQVTVLVANTTDVAGAAGNLSQALAGQQYVMAEPDDADPLLEATQVLFLPGYEAEARAVAAAAGAPAGSVQPAPDPLPVQNPGGANVLVLLGTDLASAG